MSIDPKKGGKCWSCIHCEDIATQNDNPNSIYYRKCKNANHKYVDACCFSCADYVHDPKYAENSVGSFPPSDEGTVRVNKPVAPASKPVNTPPSYSPPAAQSAQKKGGKTAVIIAIVAVVVALCAIGFLVYTMYFAPDSSDSKTNNPSKSSQSSEEYLYTPAVAVSPGGTITLRSEASTSSATVTTVYDRADVTVLKKENDWWYIEHGGSKGWCEAKYIIDAVDYLDLSYYVISTSGAYTNMYAQASSNASVVAQAPNNANVRIVKQSGLWSYVIYGSEIGWCITDDLVDSNDILNKSAIVTDSSATITVRESASTSGKSVCSVEKGSYVTVVSTNGDWYFVKYGSKSGWCSKSSLTFKEAFGSGEYAIVTTDQYELRIREYDSLSAEVLGFIPKGTVVRYYGVSANGWYYVEYGGIWGWCSGDKLTVIY